MERDWAKAVNEAFDKKGITERVDARSYADQGIDKLPQVHEGPAVRQWKRKESALNKGDLEPLCDGINKTVSFILRIFKSIIDDIDEMKNKECQLTLSTK